MVSNDYLFCSAPNRFLESHFPSYIISSSILTPLGQWIQQDLCTTSILRGSNIIFATGILVVLSKLLKVLHPGIDSMRSNLYALALGCLPVSLFYTFLYYTDTGSTFFVLLSYLLAKQRRYFGSGLVRYLQKIILSCTIMNLSKLYT
jgi:alpha-1,2-glucosyltransferase